MDAATIAETNRIRVSLGMKPLPVPNADPASDDDSNHSGSDDEDPSSTLEGRQAQAYDNYNKVQEAEAAKKKREEKAAAIRKARENAQRFALLDGKGLGEGDDGSGGDLDAKAWLLGQKKRQKKIEKARKEEQEAAARAALAAASVQYTSKDLAGIKVAHDTSAFLDGDEQVLTLKDTIIGQDEEDGDELENTAMREQEGLADRLDTKKKLHGYNPMDDDHEGGGILAQYDEEINGKQRKKFTLDAEGTIAELSDILGQPATKSARVQNISLDDMVEEGPLSSDYVDISKIKVKKPKKSKKHARQKQYDEDDVFPTQAPSAATDAMDVDMKGTSIAKKRKVADDVFVDDDDLQASLSLQRKTALKKRKKMRPEDIVKQLKDEEGAEEREEGNTGGLVIGEISEFVAGLSKPEAPKERKSRRSTSIAKTPAPDEDETMEDGEDAAHVQTVGEGSGVPHDDNGPIMDEEKNVSSMSGALALLRERGLLRPNEGDRSHEDFKNREDFLARRRAMQESLEEQTRIQRERDRASGKLDHISVQEKENYARRQNTSRDQQQSRKLNDFYAHEYKPKVDLKYTDDHGRSLGTKEAFKYLSHQFHGKGSGKGKTEKMLKKIDDEKRREAQSMFDANQNAGMQQQLKKRKEAGVRLG